MKESTERTLPFFRYERSKEIDMSKVHDRDVQNALEVIVKHAVQHGDATRRGDAANGIHHVHIRTFDELSREQRVDAVNLLLWLTDDMSQVRLPDPIKGKWDKSVWREAITEEYGLFDSSSGQIIERIKARFRESYPEAPPVPRLEMDEK